MDAVCWIPSVPPRIIRRHPFHLADQQFNPSQAHVEPFHDGTSPLFQVVESSHHSTVGLFHDERIGCQRTSVLFHFQDVSCHGTPALSNDERDGFHGTVGLSNDENVPCHATPVLFRGFLVSFGRANGRSMHWKGVFAGVCVVGADERSRRGQSENRNAL